ncbi:elongation of very long chain fatty acids protein 6-like [Coccinella septempunctata]|uniref:elongation of very long chain fatty acids protein 6-like n=1 Tax=Coccinella septempunctata TaxID=41139 RepID=UPI001D081CFD|nr:elongation of very long chain fatty acids protein 6-like [Coccinella septempunctata]
MEKSNYSFVFKFESDFDELKAQAWMRDRWTDVFYYDLIYLSVIFSIRSFMKDRTPYRMKIPLVIWNVFLASFSIMGTVRTVPELVHTLTTRGIQSSICDKSFNTTDEVTRVWSFLFVLSKVLELFDTVFVVLRKHPLILLHWYHHITTLVYCWWTYTDMVSTGRWFYVMNFFIHSLMYSYYALRGLGYKIPKQVSICITSLQILQMMVGCLVNVYGLIQIQKGIECETTHLNIFFSLVLYLSFFILFVHFFLNTYSKEKKIDPKKRQ